MVVIFERYGEVPTHAVVETDCALEFAQPVDVGPWVAPEALDSAIVLEEMDKTAI